MILYDSHVSGSLTISSSVTVGGTLTAQTIVAQTITSSIEFVTGSTRNGSLLANTHQFTGSLFQTGSTAIFMGNVGIGTTSPTGSNTSNLLHVAGNSAVLRVGPHFSVGGDRDFVEIIANGSDTKVTSPNERFYLENTAGSIIISATNNIGIGTTVPSASLHISGTTGGVFEVDGAAAINALYVSASGNVGIGTTTPVSGTLQVNGNVFATSFTGSFSGSYAGSIANATSASYAATASFANNFKVNDVLSIDSASLDYQQNLAVATGSFQTIVSVATGSFRSAFFDYVAFNGSIVRAGTVVSTWSGSVTEFYENFTGDLGGSTAVVTLQTAISASNIVLQAGISGSAWSVRSLVRLL